MDDSQGRIRRQPTTSLDFAGVRRFPRASMDVEVIVQDAHGWEIPVDSVDFSPVGMFVRSEFLFEVGQVHNLIFRSPQGDDLFSVRAQVVRVENDVDTEEGERMDVIPGMAYEFVDTDAPRQQRLRRLAARI